MDCGGVGLWLSDHRQKSEPPYKNRVKAADLGAIRQPLRSIRFHRTVALAQHFERNRDMFRVRTALDRQPSLGKTVDDFLDILGSLERLPGVMLGERICRIDLFEFVPYAMSLIGVIQMSKRGSEQDSAKVRLRR
jgi:hypothetical protein